MTRKKKDEGSPFAKLAALRASLPNDARAEAPAPPKPARCERVTAEEDVESFHRLMSGVAPLVDRGRVPKKGEDVGRTRLAPPSRAEEEAEQARARLRALVAGDARFEVMDDGRHVEGRRVDVPPAELRKLRCGQRPVDGRLDLHGKTAAEAREEIARFLGAMRARGERCVLLIHGKGKGSPGGSGVLRGEIAAWLSQGPASAHVDAFASADAEDGGEGAVYVQLRR